MKTRRQILGQHFLHDHVTIKKIREHTELTLKKTSEHTRAILEIGPGELAITKDLYEVSKNFDIPLFIVERDHLLKDGVIRSYPDLENNFHLLDAASEEFATLLKTLAASVKGKILIISNLPYSASSQILARIADQYDVVSGAIVMIQKELAERMYALTNHGKKTNVGAFTYFIHSKFETTPICDVSPKAFNPPPKVWSSVVELQPRLHPSLQETFDFKRFETFIKSLFSQRRKMIRKSLHQLSPEDWSRLGLSGQERIEELSFEQAVKLYLEAHAK